MKNNRMWKIPAVIGVNLLLGIPAIVPLFLAWYVLANGPLADLGWTQREPTENDGMLVWWILTTLAFCAFGGVWALINVWMRRRAPVSAVWYWPTCVIASLAPYSFLLVREFLKGT